MGIFFYTKYRFHWGLSQNLCLAAAQGAAYTVGSLLASRLSARFGRRRSLIVLYFLAGATCLFMEIASNLPVGLAILLSVYMLIISMNWPMLESIVASDCGARELSRRIGIYNLVWSGSGAIAVAFAGVIIERATRGLFLLPLLAHVAAAISMILFRRSESAATSDQPAHLHPEAELLHLRVQALWLSRIALPAMYVVNYSLASMMPLLPVIRTLSPAMQTLLSSTWLIARWITFLVLGTSVFWHTRPRLMLIAAIGMLTAFLLITLPTSLVLFVCGQVVLGACTGMIYTASLYFGMVLSEGSTEHGGYRESLIGLGSVLGPGAAALTQLRWPDAMMPAIIAVGAIVSVSVVCATAVALRARRE
jgi:MFS family permease